MANIKNFGIVGVGAGVQFGKGGAQLIQTSGTFAAKNATGNAFVRFQIADGASGGDAVTFNQLTNAVSAIGVTTNAIQTELDAVELGAGLNTDGTYTAPTGTTYLANATSLANADVLIDAAVAAEVARALAAESTLTNAVTNAATAASLAQAELDQIETSVGLETDGTLTLAAGNYLANAVDLVSAIELLDSAIGNVATNDTAFDGRVSALESNVAILQGEVSDLDSNVSTLSGRVDVVEANTVAQQGLITNLRTDVDSNSALLATTVTDLSTLTDRVTTDEATANALANTVATITTSVSDEANARIAADTVLQGKIDAANAAVVTETGRATAAESDLSNAVAAANTAVSTEAARAIAAEGVLTSALANTDSNVATLSGKVASDEANASALAAVVAQDGTDIANNAAAIVSTDSNVAAIASSYVNKDGSVAMTGDLNMAEHVIANVATPVLDTDAANKGYVTDLIATLANAFEYKGTVSPGVDAGNAVVLSNTTVAGSYYKADADGYLIGAESGSVAFHVFKNDGVVRNTQSDGAVGTWDTIAHTESTVDAVDSSIAVTGSVDTGFHVGVSTTYTAARTQAVTDEANARIAADGVNAQAVTDEANARIAADSTLANSIASANAGLAQELTDRANAVAAEAVLRAQGDTDNANATANAVLVETNRATAAEAVLQGEIDSANTSVSTETARAEQAESDLANSIANATSSVSTETTRAEAAESALANAIASTDSNVSTVANSVSTETARAEAAEVALSNSIVDETTRAEAAEAVLTSDLANTDANAVTLSARVDVLESSEANAVADEANARIAADALINANVAALANTVAQDGTDIANTNTLVQFVQYSAGLQNDGSYAANATGHYVANALSLHDADDLLDAAVFDLSQQLADLSQDTIKTSDGLNSVHVANNAVSMKLNNAVVANFTAGANTNTVLGVDFTTADTVALLATGSGTNVDLRLAGQGSGQVIIGETGVGVIASDAGYDMTVAGGAGANLNLLGTNVIIGEADGTSVAQFTGTAGASAYATVQNGNTAVTFGAAGSASNLDLVFAPKGTGSVNVSSAKIINVANATQDTDAVNYGQMNAAISTAAVGIVKTVIASLPATGGSVTLGTVTGTILRVRVLVSAAYDVGSTITVGNSGTANDLAADTDIDEGTVGIYVVETAKDYTATSVTATVTNATGLNGAAKVVVEYLSA
jgi:hypothetical protein